MNTLAENTKTGWALGILASCIVALVPAVAFAQTALFQKGDAVVSGFSGTSRSAPATAPDQTVIDVNGASAQN
jgi:hypothetical protein